MGEAKRRGTYEERKAAAIERNKLLAAARRNSVTVAGRPSGSWTTLVAAAMITAGEGARMPTDKELKR